jgi:tetratricopeptide (TPR) repeat protein
LVYWRITEKVNPKDARVFNNRGVAHRKLGKEEKAIEDFKTAQALDPSIIANEKIKALEKEFAERICRIHDCIREFRQKLLLIFIIFVFHPFKHFRHCHTVAGFNTVGILSNLL